MSLEAVAWALRQNVGCPTSKLLLIGICDCHNLGTDECFPAIKTLMRVANASRSTVIRKLADLERNGWVSKESRYTDSGRQTSNCYQIDFGRSPGGCQVETLPGKQASGGCQADTPEGSRAVKRSVPLTGKINKKRGGARKTPAKPAAKSTPAPTIHKPEHDSRQIDLAEGTPEPEQLSEQHRQRMKRGFQDLLANLRGGPAHNGRRVM
jgi:DNA-binding transcriptional MocR family regulator